MPFLQTIQAQVEGVIESKYMKNGPYAVKKQEDHALQNFSKYEIFYPAELETSDRTWPVVVLCNGTGVPLSRYAAIAQHYASWGFIVIGSEEAYSWNGCSAEMALRHLERLDENEKIGDQNSVFYHKVDFDRVGAVGHSQGGVGAMNAASVQPHHDVFKTIVALSPTNLELAENLEWVYDPSLVPIPTLLISGAGGGDDPVVNKEQLEEIYAKLPGQKVMMRRVDTPHGDILYKADGYVTTWLMAQLQDDLDAAKAFAGEKPEILSNSLYQDQKLDMEKAAQ